jgi:hypothetical protein
MSASGCKPWLVVELVAVLNMFILFLLTYQEI